MSPHLQFPLDTTDNKEHMAKINKTNFVTDNIIKRPVGKQTKRNYECSLHFTIII